MKRQKKMIMILTFQKFETKIKVLNCKSNNFDRMYSYLIRQINLILTLIDIVFLV